MKRFSLASLIRPRIAPDLGSRITGRSIYLFLCIAGLFLVLQCRRIHIPVPEPRDTSGVSQSERALPGARFVKGDGRLFLRFEGERASSRDWVQAYAVSRLFHHGIVNESGTPGDLLYAGFERVLLSRGYKVSRVDGESGDLPGTGRFMRIRIQTLRTYWFPPQEFIETVRPIRRGRITIEMDFVAVLPDGQAFPFLRKIETEAYPGEEYAKIESLTSMLFAEFVGDVLDRFMAAEEMRK